MSSWAAVARNSSRMLVEPPRSPRRRGGPTTASGGRPARRTGVAATDTKTSRPSVRRSTASYWAARSPASARPWRTDRRTAAPRPGAELLAAAPRLQRAEDLLLATRRRRGRGPRGWPRRSRTLVHEQDPVAPCRRRSPGAPRRRRFRASLRRMSAKRTAAVTSDEGGALDRLDRSRRAGSRTARRPAGRRRRPTRARATAYSAAIGRRPAGRGHQRDRGLALPPDATGCSEPSWPVRGATSFVYRPTGPCHRPEGPVCLRRAGESPRGVRPGACSPSPSMRSAPQVESAEGRR